MRTAVFSTKEYDRQFLTPAAREAGHELHFFESRLLPESAMLAAGFPAVCAFVNDQLTADVLAHLHEGGTRVVALRAAGFNNVDLDAAERLGLPILRVPAYSPHGVAEHAIGLMLTLNRKFHKAYNRVREGNFSLDGLLGFDMFGRTAGVVGTGQIGLCAIRLLAGFGCRVLAHDPFENEQARELGATYVPLPQLLAECDMVTLHCPLTPGTRHMINGESIQTMKRGMMLINTGRGGLINTQAVIEGLKSGQIGALGLDVYEEEADLFFEDLSSTVIQDDVFMRLLTFPNVLITGHQAFFTQNALQAIASSTMENLTAFEQGREMVNRVKRRT